MGARAEVELRERFLEQKELLKKAITGFYAGDLAESLNIAARIRVFVHEKGSSVPLLKQINPDYLGLTILERNPKGAEQAAIKARTLGKQSFCAVAFSLGPHGTIKPVSDLSDHEMTTLGAWWSRPCLMFPYEDGTNPIFTRSEVILTLAEKEGGVHLDPSLPVHYASLIKQSALRVHCAGQEMNPFDLGKFFTGEAGTQLFDCLQRNFPRKSVTGGTFSP